MQYFFYLPIKQLKINDLQNLKNSAQIFKPHARAYLIACEIVRLVFLAFQAVKIATKSSENGKYIPKKNIYKKRTDTLMSWAQGLFRKKGVVRKATIFRISVLRSIREDTKKARTLLSEPFCVSLSSHKSHRIIKLALYS